jgi:MFS family permease
LSLYLSAPFAMLSEVFEPKDRPKYFGMLVAFKAIGSFVGPIITGAMMDATLVNLAFLSYIPFMIIATPFILALYPNVKTNRMQGKKFDLAGIILVVVCVSCIIFFLTLGGKLFEWLSPQGLVLLFIGIVSLFLLIRIETRHENPSVAIYLFKKKRFLAAFLCAFCLSVFGVAIAAYGYVYTQQIMQVSATVSSTTTIPMTIAQVLFGFVIGRYFSKRFISRFRGAALISIVLTIAAVGGLCFLTPDSSMILIYVVSLLGGVGSVVPQSAFANFFQTELQPQEIAAAQGLFTFGSTIGPTIFMAISGAMLNAGLNYINVFMLAVVFCVVGLVIGIVGLKFPKDMVLADKSDKQAE